ncbi:unnamed protein product [Somion occarium]|uniref:Transmembrane protein n=1 Tax=Somion occarium TaxID=3059160 RepID=A0ABP1D4B4_9APHY
MLTYQPRAEWWEDTVQHDQFLEGYSTKTCHSTSSSHHGSASITLQWFGEGSVWVYGGYRQRLGEYQVVLDTAIYTQQGYHDGDQEQPQFLLFNRSDLPSGHHQLQLVNTSQDPNHPVLDLDYIVFQTPAEDSTVVDDASHSISWRPDPSNSQEPVWQQDSSSHFTEDVSGWMELNFTGNDQSYRYASGISSDAPFSVSLDGWKTVTLTPNTLAPFDITESQLLYFKYDLTYETHTLSIANNPSSTMDEKMRLSIDKVMVYQSTTNAHGNVNPDSTSHHSSSKSKVAIAVGVSVGALVLSITVFVLWRCWRSQRKHYLEKFELFRIKPYRRAPQHSRGPSQEMSTVDFASVHSQTDSRRLLPSSKRISRAEASSEELLVHGLNQSSTDNTIYDSIMAEPPDSPTPATIVADDFDMPPTPMTPYGDPRSTRSSTVLPRSSSRLSRWSFTPGSSTKSTGDTGRNRQASASSTRRPSIPRIPSTIPRIPPPLRLSLKPSGPREVSPKPPHPRRTETEDESQSIDPDASFLRMSYSTGNSSSTGRTGTKIAS